MIFDFSKPMRIMKVHILPALLSVAAMLGCSREMLPSDDGGHGEPLKGQVSFFGEMTGTKSVPAGNGDVAWSADDRIGVYDGQNYVLATITEVDGKSVRFSADVDADAESYVAVVPYEAALTGGSFSGFHKDGAVKMLSCTAEQESGLQVYCVASTTAAERRFSFRNVGNLIRFRLEKRGVVKAVFRGNGGEKIAGTLTVDPADGNCLSAELESDSISLSVTEGENFIAVAPDIDLKDGFTVTFYGDADCTDYQGEVVGSKALELGRNEMKNLGTVDGWIDNYKLWIAGKTISVAGVEYSRSSTGLSGELLSADEGDYDLFGKLYGKSGAFFLEQSSGHRFVSSKFINIGSANAASDVLLISRYDNAPVDMKPGGNFTLFDGNFIAKGVRFEIKAAEYSTNWLFRTFTKTAFGKLHLDGCKYSVDGGAKQFLTFNNKTIHGVRSIRIVNSRIESAVDGTVQLLYSSTDYPFLNEIAEVTFDNVAVYNRNAGGKVQLFGTAGPKPSSGEQRTDFTLTNCTFYNMAPTTFYQSYSMGSLTVKNNLFFSEAVPAGSTIVAYSQDDAYEYNYVFDNNFCNFNSLYWFNPNTGVYKTLKKTVTKTSEAMFAEADAENGNFVPAPGFESCGARL